jgi:hypothetical protein
MLVGALFALALQVQERASRLVAVLDPEVREHAAGIVVAVGDPREQALLGGIELQFHDRSVPPRTRGNSPFVEGRGATALLQSSP